MMNKDMDKYVQLELLNQQLQELEQAIKMADEQFEYASIAVDVLSSLETAKDGQELLVPIGNGVFLNVKAEDISNVKFGVGAGVVVDKDAKSAATFIKQRLVELEDYREKSLATFDQVATKALGLQAEIEKNQSK